MAEHDPPADRAEGREGLGVDDDPVAAGQPLGDRPGGDRGDLGQPLAVVAEQGGHVPLAVRHQDQRLARPVGPPDPVDVGDRQVGLGREPAHLVAVHRAAVGDDHGRLPLPHPDRPEVPQVALGAQPVGLAVGVAGQQPAPAARHDGEVLLAVGLGGGALHPVGEPHLHDRRPVGQHGRPLVAELRPVADHLVGPLARAVRRPAVARPAAAASANSVCVGSTWSARAAWSPASTACDRAASSASTASARRAVRADDPEVDGVSDADALAVGVGVGAACGSGSSGRTRPASTRASRTPPTSTTTAPRTSQPGTRLGRSSSSEGVSGTRQAYVPSRLTARDQPRRQHREFGRLEAMFKVRSRRPRIPVHARDRREPALTGGDGLWSSKETPGRRPHTGQRAARPR